MVTADLTKETSDKLEKLQASAVIYKPFDIKNVIKTVENIVGTQRNIPTISKQSELLIQPIESTLQKCTQEIRMIQK
jgi:DNA-binding response OmpR family regulator